MIKGSSLDTRLQSALLLDPKLQRRLDGDEFRSFVNIMIFTVTQVTDGVFNLDDAEMVFNPSHLENLVNVGVIEADDAGLYRIHPDYWSWQTSKADLMKQDAKRTTDRLRKQKERSTPDKAGASFDAPEPEPIMQPRPPWETS